MHKPSFTRAVQTIIARSSRPSCRTLGRERRCAARPSEAAMDVDSEDEAVMGGAPVGGVLDAASQLTFADLSEDSDDE